MLISTLIISDFFRNKRQDIPPGSALSVGNVTRENLISTMIVWDGFRGKGRIGSQPGPAQTSGDLSHEMLVSILIVWDGCRGKERICRMPGSAQTEGHLSHGMLISPLIVYMWGRVGFIFTFIVTTYFESFAVFFEFLFYDLHFVCE